MTKRAMLAAIVDEINRLSADGRLKNYRRRKTLETYHASLEYELGDYKVITAGAVVDRGA